MWPKKICKLQNLGILAPFSLFYPTVESIEKYQVSLQYVESSLFFQWTLSVKDGHKCLHRDQTIVCTAMTHKHGKMFVNCKLRTLRESSWLNAH